MITADDLQTSLQSIRHSADDCRNALETGDEDIIEASLNNIQAIIEELYNCLPRRCEDEQSIDDIADSISNL